MITSTTTTAGSTAISEMYQVANNFATGILNKDLCYHNEYEFFYTYGKVIEPIPNPDAEQKSTSDKPVPKTLGNGIAIVQTALPHSEDFPPVKHILLPEGYKVENIAPNMPTDGPFDVPPSTYNGGFFCYPCIGTILSPSGQRMYISHTDCNGFVSYVVTQVSVEAYREIPKGRNNQPWRSSISFSEFFNRNVAGNYWKTIVRTSDALDAVAEVLPGDIVAWHDGEGGHIMVAGSVPRKCSNLAELTAIVPEAQAQASTLTCFPYYALEVIDATNVARFNDQQAQANAQNGGQHLGVEKDTIPPTAHNEVINQRSGVSIGVILLSIQPSPNNQGDMWVANGLTHTVPLISIGIGRYTPVK